MMTNTTYQKNSPVEIGVLLLSKTLDILYLNEYFKHILLGCKAGDNYLAYCQDCLIEPLVIATPKKVKFVEKLIDGKAILFKIIPFRDNETLITAEFNELSHKTKENLVNKIKKITGHKIAIEKPVESLFNELIQFYEYLLFHMPENVYWSDRNGVTLGCNKTTLERLGLKEVKDFVGMTYEQLAPIVNWDIEVARGFERDDMFVMNNNTPILSKKEPPLLSPDGSIIYYISDRFPIKNAEGEVTGVIGISFDATKLIKVQQQLEAALAENQQANIEREEKVLARYKNFVLNQEHDMRTPAANVVCLANGLLNYLHDPLHINIAEYIQKSAQAQLDYQNSMLDTIYLFNDETELYQRRFELKKRLEQSIDMFLCAFQKKNITFTFDYDSQIPRFLVGDWFRLQQILLRLFSNAVEFTSEGGAIWLRCHTGRLTEDRVTLLIELEDTGIGMNEEQMSTIFEPFVRLSLSNVGKYQGRGVGLAFVKKLMNDLQGETEVSSILGKGTIFRLIIPYTVSLSDKPMSVPQGLPPS